MTYWAEFTTTMFSKAPELKEVTYSGMLDDQPVLKITVTRQQFDEKLSTVQETIASYAAITFAKLGLHKTDDKGALKDQEQQKTKTYKTALSFLPKDQVMISLQAGHLEVDSGRVTGARQDAPPVGHPKCGMAMTPRPSSRPKTPKETESRAVMVARLTSFSARVSLARRGRTNSWATPLRIRMALQMM